MLYFIRHAQSFFNQDADEKLRETMGEKYSKKSPEFLALKFDKKYLDCGLTEKGRDQCLKARKNVLDLDIKLILVSPMRRALQTCDIIFKDHPSKPKIIVDPGVREIFSSSCDIGSRLRESMQDFPHFDFSEIKDPDFWYIESIKNEEVKEKLLVKLTDLMKEYKAEKNEEMNKIRNQLALETMLDYLKEAYGTINHYSLSNFEAQKSRLKILAKEYGKVAVVSHHDNIITYTHKATKNCEVLQFSSDNL